MPNHIKAIVSVLALLVTSVGFYFDHQAGAGIEKWVMLSLGPLMVGAIWLFPETKQRKPK